MHVLIDSTFMYFAVAGAGVGGGRYGRKHSQTSLYGLAAVGVLLTGLPLGKGVSRITAILARIASMAATSVTMVITPELFPTSMRASGHSVASSFARLGGFATPFLVNSPLSIFLVALVLAIGNAIAMLFAFALPETKGKGSALWDTAAAATSTSSSKQ
jgi:MFS family permease